MALSFSPDLAAGAAPRDERGVTLADLDALIDACPGAAMIVLSEPDWRATMEDPAGAALRSYPDGSRVNYSGLPVWIAMPGVSRVLSAAEVEAEGLQDLGS